MKKVTAIVSVMTLVVISVYISSCSTIEKISSKSGAQLWGENCIRCHNAPSPDTFSDVQWDVAGLHMQIRGNLTVEETTKVIEFLKSAN